MRRNISWLRHLTEFFSCLINHLSATINSRKKSNPFFINFALNAIEINTFCIYLAFFNTYDRFLAAVTGNMVLSFTHKILTAMSIVKYLYFNRMEKEKNLLALPTHER